MYQSDTSFKGKQDNRYFTAHRRTSRLLCFFSMMIALALLTVTAWHDDTQPRRTVLVTGGARGIGRCVAEQSAPWSRHQEETR